MKIKQDTMTIAIVAIVAIAGIAIYSISKNSCCKGMMDSKNMSSMMQDTTPIVAANKNSSDYKMYSMLTGEDYDRTFIANMIEHHAGAVDMAKLALSNAKHQELKDLAKAIVSAQTSEITNMKQWQKNWGYPASSGDMMMDHSAMGMMDNMASMTGQLKGLTDDAFDKKFLELMIEHHQSAIDMSTSGAENASHQEVKDLTKAIVLAQSKEITQMKQWQKNWGY